MKKIYILLGVCLVIITSTDAQRKISLLQSHAIKQLPKAADFVTNGTAAAGCDTVNLPIPDNWNLDYYYYDAALPIDSGFISGTNFYDDVEKANYFDLSAQNYNYILGTQVYFAQANSSTAANLSKNVVFKVYADNNGYPGLLLGSASKPLSSIKDDVNGNFATEVIFSSPIAMPASKKIYVSVDISAFSFNNGDSIAIVSTSIGDLADGTGTAFERWSDNNNSWHNFNSDSTYQFDAALAIFPYVSTTEGACGILPVKLISFDAARKNKDAIINWKVAEESNMKGYQLEKADNNNNYKPVTFIKAHNDYKNNFYTYTDANAFSGAANIQYRLKQIDGDGKTEYSKIISLKAGAAINNVVFANPFISSLRLQLNLASPSKISINIYDMKGNLVGSEKPVTYNGATNYIEVKSARVLNSGMYILKVTAGDEQLNYKIMKQ